MARFVMVIFLLALVCMSAASPHGVGAKAAVGPVRGSASLGHHATSVGDHGGAHAGVGAGIGGHTDAHADIGATHGSHSAHIGVKGHH